MMRSRPGQILVLGSANADLTVTLARRPGSGETVHGRDLVVLPGGKGANQAAAAGRLGGRVLFAGCVGTDGYGDLLLRALTSAGVDVSAVRRVETATGVAMISVTPDGDNSIIVVPGANYEVTIADVDALSDAIAEAAVLVLQMELTVEVVVHAAAVAARHGTRVLLNLAPTVPIPPETLGACDPLVVNEHEAAFLLGGQLAGDWATTAQRLSELGPASVVITLGAEGALSYDGAGAVFFVPPPAVKPVDTTGAGDAFIGALSVCLANGDQLPEATRYAVRVGSTAVLKRGAQTSYPTPDEVLPEARA